MGASSGAVPPLNAIRTHLNRRRHLRKITGKTEVGRGGKGTFQASRGRGLISKTFVTSLMSLLLHSSSPSPCLFFIAIVSMYTTGYATKNTVYIALEVIIVKQTYRV